MSNNNNSPKKDTYDYTVVNGTIYPLNTVKEIQVATKKMADAKMKSAPIWRMNRSPAQGGTVATAVITRFKVYS